MISRLRLMISPRMNNKLPIQDEGYVNKTWPMGRFLSKAYFEDGERTSLAITRSLRYQSANFSSVKMKYMVTDTIPHPPRD
ncbi:hypothetical protein QFZ78_004473 [Paenibacillus sp. V4I5]|nr:hypothetical protein [Paenibacillus sp. V4I5]